MKRKTAAEVLENKRLSSDVFDIKLKAGDIAAKAAPGTFVMLYLRDGSHLLPRPISICEAENGIVRLVYRVVGFGTDRFSKLKDGQTLDILGPLGKGFDIKPGRSLLFGGGVGIPPMLYLAKEIYQKTGEKPTAVLGYRDSDTFLDKDFAPYADVILCTDDGTLGQKGNVIEVARRLSLPADNIYACGPLPMLRGVKEYSGEISAPAQISLEERMACGFGVCLGCVVKTTEVDEHSRVKNKRVCKDGPVFYADEVDI